MNAQAQKEYPYRTPGWRGASRLLSVALLCACLASVQPAAQAAPIVEQAPASHQVNGTLYLSVPAAAFHPKWLQYYDYINNGDFLIHKGHTYGAPGIYYAPLRAAPPGYYHKGHILLL